MKKQKLLFVCYSLLCCVGYFGVDYFKYSERTDEKDFVFAITVLLLLIQNIWWILRERENYQCSMVEEKRHRAIIKIMMAIVWFLMHSTNLFIYYDK